MRNAIILGLLLSSIFNLKTHAITPVPEIKDPEIIKAFLRNINAVQTGPSTVGRFQLVVIPEGEVDFYQLFMIDTVSGSVWRFFRPKDETRREVFHPILRLDTEEAFSELYRLETKEP